MGDHMTSGLLLPPGPRDAIKWRGLFVVEKFWADDDLTRATPYDVVEGENLLTTAGAQAVFNRLMGTGSVTAFDASNAYLGVGDSSTAAAVGQTDLQGASKTRKVVDALPIISGNTWTLVATFLTSDANHAWNEAGIFNASSSGTMLNRVVQSFGTKTSSSQWVLTGVVTAS